MPIQRTGTLNTSGYGTGTTTAPVVPVPNPNGNAGGVAPGQETYNPSGGSMNWNPIPNNTPVNPGDVTGFVTSFKFGDQHKTGDPVKDMAMETFNKIKDQFGHNAAWSFAMENWNQLGGYGTNGLRGIMDRAGITGTDQNRIVNTYGSSKSNYFDGLRNERPVSFDPNSPYNQLTNQYKTYANQYATAKQKGLQPPALPQGYSVGAFGAGSNFQATGTNKDPVPPAGYGGQQGIDPSTGKAFGAAPAVAAPVPQAATQNPPSVTVPQAPATGVNPSMATVGLQAPSTTDPMGTAPKQSFRYRQRKPIGF